VSIVKISKTIGLIYNSINNKSHNHAYSIHNNRTIQVEVGFSEGGDDTSFEGSFSHGFGGAGRMSAFTRSLSTVSLGCAPTVNQYLIRSMSMLMCFSPFASGIGLYVPTFSMCFPSRGEQLLATTI